MSINEKEMRAACTKELFAAEAANLLVKNSGISFRDAYKNIAENPGMVEELTTEKIMTEFTHLGSPARPGFSELKSRL